MYPIKHVRSSVLSGLVGLRMEVFPTLARFLKVQQLCKLKETCMQATLPVYVHVLSQVNCLAWLQGIKVA